MPICFGIRKINLIKSLRKIAYFFRQYQQLKEIKLYKKKNIKVKILGLFHKKITGYPRHLRIENLVRLGEDREKLLKIMLKIFKDTIVPKDTIAYIFKGRHRIISKFLLVL